MGNDLVAIYSSFAADLNPFPIQGRTPRAARPRLAAQQTACPAFFDHQSVFACGLKITAVFAVVFGDAQKLSSIFIVSHIVYFLIMSALPTAGVPHPIFILTSASFTWRQPPSE